MGNWRSVTRALPPCAAPMVAPLGAGHRGAERRPRHRSNETGPDARDAERCGRCRSYLARQSPARHRRRAKNWRLGPRAARAARDAKARTLAIQGLRPRQDRADLGYAALLGSEELPAKARCGRWSVARPPALPLWAWAMHRARFARCGESGPPPRSPDQGRHAGRSGARYARSALKTHSPARKRSASRAAMQPIPAEVIAWR